MVLEVYADAVLLGGLDRKSRSDVVCLTSPLIFGHIIIPIMCALPVLFHSVV